MTQEPNQQNNQTQPQTEKLLIDNPQNFQFHAAYMVYSETFDKTTNPQARKTLNQNIQDLKDNKIDSATFYLNISSYRKIEVPRPERFSMPQTQRKKDWRRKEQRQDRIKRHKK
ncbi:MAG: hypothetical protein NWE95_12585 [Candidatus Bathyarchaeota archaeon]|nr:hypothetical protein [Candidatus Bathyarchaeota archaeon]